jgi:hypothetical protein
MDNDPRFVDGAFPFKLYGQEFSASMLTDRDYADLTGYIQSKYLEMAKVLGRSEYKFAIAALSSITWFTQEGMEIIGTNEGTMRVGWQMIRKRHPDVDFEDFLSHLPKEIVPRDEALSAVVDAYNILHRVDKGDAPTGAGKSS